MAEFPAYKTIKTADLIPYARNSRTHSDAQVAKLAASIKEFGFLNPVIVDGDNGIIAGHGRILAAQKLGLEAVPTIEADHLTEAQRRAYVIADNRLALDAGWDDELLRIELGDLNADGFDLSLTGFDLDELSNIFLDGNLPTDKEILSENYSRKIESPVYEITGDKPEISQMIDRQKTERLKNKILQSDLPDDVKEFLNFAAERHTVFNFKNIAEYYAHADQTVQELMEESAMIIVDFDRAIEDGYVKLASGMMDQVREIKEND